MLKVSIIISTLNADRTIYKALQSIRAQTYQNLELIIIDGGSSDSTVEIIRENQDIISYWISERDTGIYAAWNKGLNQVSGDWIYFIGADDYLWDNKVLENTVKSILNSDPEVLIVYGSIYMVNRDYEIISEEGIDWEHARKKFMSYMNIPHQGVFTSKKYFDIHGNFDESYKIGGDYEHLLRGIIDRPPFYIKGLIVAGMGNEGISNNLYKAAAIQWEARRAQANHVGLFPTLEWCYAIIRILIKIALLTLLGPKIFKKILSIIEKIRDK